MPRYIDVDEAIRISKEDKFVWVYDLTDLEEFLTGVPSADVVPKSEVAREIFEEIYNKLDKEIERYKWFARDTIDNTPTMIYGTAIGMLINARQYIEELNKKYTEDK